MTVMSNPGPIQVGAGDFQRTDRGVHWAIKCRVLEGMQIVLVVVQQPDGSWNFSDHPAEGTLDPEFHNSATAYPMVKDWFTSVLIPKLNAWLKLQFGALAAPPAPLDRFEQADQFINTLLVIQADASGALVASVKP